MKFVRILSQLKKLDIRKIPGYFARGVYTITILWVWQTLTFIWLLFVYLLYKFSSKLLSFRFFPSALTTPLLQVIRFHYQKATTLSQRGERTINRINLIDLAFRNMMFKKSRSIVTIGGMAIGIGAIVFLVSIGFGLQELIIRRVARLDELKQAEVSSLPGSKEKITDQTISKIQEMSGVDKVLPQIATVAKVSIQKSVSDMAVYGVTTSYLEHSAIQPIRGNIFSSNELVYEIPHESEGVVAGASTEETSVIEETTPVTFTTNTVPWARVRSEPSRDAPILGYIPLSEKVYEGSKVWGEFYPESEDDQTFLEYEGQKYASWVSAEFELWEKNGCEPELEGCVDGYFPLFDEDTGYAQSTGYIAAMNVEFLDQSDRPTPQGRVLGITSTEDEKPVLLAQATNEESEGTSEASVESASSSAVADFIEAEDGWVEIASESTAMAKTNTKKVALADSAKKEAVINVAMLKVMGLTEEEAVGKTFEVSFVVVGELLNNSEDKLESINAEYTIVGIVPDDKTPFFYVPFIDLRGLGISNYSQLKVVTNLPEELATVRKQIEAFGLSSRSVADTVKQIDQLFATARILLSVLGFVALSIAALGMFNTLTVSLLERTREVGLMKAMGMKSHEVQELFLTESLVMGFFGGLAGIFLGFLAGKALGLLLSVLSISKGAGFIDVSYLPLSFIIFIFLLSLFVGIVTGIFPALRATKISALDALRYE